MPRRLDRTYTFDMDNQPGIATGVIRRSQIVDAVRALGIDPMHITSDLIIGDDHVQVTAMLTTTEGHRVLGHSGPEPEGHLSGYVKHIYKVPIVDDVEDMTPSEYYKHKADEDYATYKRVREDIIARYGDEEAYIKHTS